MFGKPEIVSPTIDNADLRKGQVFSVYPTGIPETDWQNIVNAFDQASKAGSGNIVRLEAGHFRIHKEVLVEGFNGSFCGAGKNVTIIEPGLSSSNEPFEGLAGVIFLESEEELHITDMTMQVTHPTPTTLEQFDYGLGWFFIVNHFVNCNTSFERVCIKGAEGQYPYWAPAGFKKLNNALLPTVFSVVF